MTTWEGPSFDAIEQAHRLTLADFLDEIVALHGTREALVFDDPLRDDATIRWTYADLGDAARRMALALVDRGVTLGTRVGILLGNRPEFVAALFGIALAGGVAVPLSTFSTPSELVDLIDRSGVAGVLTQSALGARSFGTEVAELVGRDDLGYLRWSATVDSADFEGPALAGPELLAARRARIEPAEPGLILFSSGTTAEPKGMVHLHRAPTTQFWILAEVFRRRTDSRVWAPLPLFWTAGLTTALGPTLAGGGTFVLQEIFDATSALRLLARERVTEPYTLPHQATALRDHPDFATTDLSSLREVYGKSVFTRHPSVNGDTTWTMPVGFGMSETCAIVLTHYWHNSRAEMEASTGRLLPGVRLRIVDPLTHEALGPNTDGELALSGPTVLDHYLGMSREETLVADGFLPTGDMGFVDDAGEVHWTGRRTEVIKTAGANVSPAELEFKLRAHPGLTRTKVLGLPDERLGEVVVLCAEPVDGVEVTSEELLEFLGERVARYKLPRHIVFFAPGEMPATASDTKVRDADLATLVAERLGRPAAG
jgi:acyl-CoA synthetase (AMP-forming)/AMP-acid ligase II